VNPAAILLAASASRSLSFAKDRWLSPCLARRPKVPEHPGGPRR